MSIDNNSDDGSDIFWPGYVDAVTNLVLNLLFLLTIMTVAVFMFALELGRASLGGAGKSPPISITPDTVNTPKLSNGPIEERTAAVKALQKQVEALSKVSPTDAAALRKQVEAINSALNREIKLLNMMSVPHVPLVVRAGEPVTVVPATVTFPKPKTGLDITVVSDGEVVVRFTDEAISLTPAENTQLREALRSIVARGKSHLLVEVPTGFSEAKRMGFYRAMAVRNLLIEMKMPQDHIEVSVLEGKNDSNASLVRVKSK